MVFSIIFQNAKKLLFLIFQYVVLSCQSHHFSRVANFYPGLFKENAMFLDFFSRYSRFSRFLQVFQIFKGGGAPELPATWWKVKAELLALISELSHVPKHPPAKVCKQQIPYTLVARNWCVFQWGIELKVQTLEWPHWQVTQMWEKHQCHNRVLLPPQLHTSMVGMLLKIAEWQAWRAVMLFSHKNKTTIRQIHQQYREKCLVVMSFTEYPKRQPQDIQSTKKTGTLSMRRTWNQP